MRRSAAAELPLWGLTGMYIAIMNEVLLYFFVCKIYESPEWQIHRWKVRFDVKMEIAWNADQQYKRWGMQHGQIYADD